MLLVNTSVRVRHLRQGEEVLRERLAQGLVLTHPYVVGELACGGLKDGDRILSYLRAAGGPQVARYRGPTTGGGPAAWGTGAGMDRRAPAGFGFALALRTLDNRPAFGRRGGGIGAEPVTGSGGFGATDTAIGKCPAEGG